MLPDPERNGWPVPANCSRFFDSPDEARRQPTAFLDLRWSAHECFFTNIAHRPDLISHDDNYFTGDTFHLKDSLVVLQPLIDDFKPRRLVEIGCGQGELLDSLNDMFPGLALEGFDPVAKNPTDRIRKRYFDPHDDVMRVEEKEARPNFYVMRCVLPHIPEPFEFLDRLFSADPSALVYLEYQRLEWLLANRVWFGFSHDHVNYFTDNTFGSRYTVERGGSFAEQEWGFVLIRSTPEAVGQSSTKVEPDLRPLIRQRHTDLQGLRNERFYVYSAAGKATQFCFAFLKDAQSETGPLGAIDANPVRQGRFLEVSAVEVIGLESAIESLERGGVVLVLNPRHADFAREALPNNVEIRTIPLSESHSS